MSSPKTRTVGCVLTAGNVQLPHVVSPAQRANPADALEKLAARMQNLYSV